MKSICFFNNKGGVGKTTLVCNVASYIATRYHARVLLVDADPQCNATQLMLSEDMIDELYGRKGGSGSKEKGQTLFHVLGPIAAGEPNVVTKVKPMRSSLSKFRVDLIAGHPQVALLEDTFSQAWLDFNAGKVGGARVVNWNTQLLDRVTAAYDFVFYDVGPSLGALNRTVLVGTDFFLTPMGCDIFSLMGISNISRWLSGWTKAYKQAMEKCEKDWSPNMDLSQYIMKRDISKMPRFIGYTVQQYIAKAKGGVKRPTKAYERILKGIPKTIEKELTDFLANNITASKAKLPDVPHMYSLVPLSQNAKTPIHFIESADGLVGAQYSQKEAYVAFIDNLVRALLKNLNWEGVL